MKKKVIRGSLNQVLAQIAKQLSLGLKKLQQAAQQAPYAAQRPDGKPWPTGTGSENEKRIVYVLAHVHPLYNVIDLGTRWGAMAIQLASAGYPVVSVDIDQYIGGTKHRVGKFIPSDLPVTLIHNGAVEYLAGQDDESIGLIFEDTAHTAEVTHLIYEQAKKKLTPGGIIISHDVCILRWAMNIRTGFEMAAVDPELYLVDGDGCGLSIWQKPSEAPEPVIKRSTAVHFFNTGEDNYVEGKIVDESIPGPVYIEDLPEIEEPAIELESKPKKKRRTKKKKTIEDA